MNDREWLAPEALAVIDAGEGFTSGEYPSLPVAAVTWNKAGRPLLTARARAVLVAVEAAMVFCARCDGPGWGCEGNDYCAPSLKAIRRAYLGDGATATTKSAPVCETCGGEGREECVECDGTIACTNYYADDDCTIPCPACGAKEEGR